MTQMGHRVVHMGGFSGCARVCLGEGSAGSDVLMQPRLQISQPSDFFCCFYCLCLHPRFGTT